MSKDAFKDMLDGLVQEEAPAPPPVEEVQESSDLTNGLAADDPYAHLVGRRVDPELAAKDPFAMLLDGVLASEGLCKETPTEDKNPEAENHNWEADKIAIFEEDELLMTCSKCCRQMRMSRKETPNEAMDRHQIARDCSMQTVGEVMND